MVCYPKGAKCRESKLSFSYIMWAGQPRTGNAAYADLVEDIVGRSNIFRGKFFLLRVPDLVKLSLICPV